MTDIRRRPLAGNLRWRDANQVDITVPIDRLAVDNCRLVLLSWIRPSSPGC
jgi:hypothetical protein